MMAKELTRKRLTQVQRLITIVLLLFVILSFFTNPSIALAEEIEIAGITEPYQNAVLGLTVYGQISEVYFKEGEKVKKGALILEMDKKLEDLEVERRNLIWESKAEVKSALAHIAMLEPHLKATKDLYQSTGSISKEELEKQELEYALAQIKHQQLLNAEDREQIEYHIALAQLNKRKLFAPFTGIISTLYLHVGESCEPDEPLVQMVDTSKFYFVCNIEEDIYTTLKLDQTVQLKIQSGSGSTEKSGRVSFISPIVDSASGLRKLKILVQNMDGKIIPGVPGQLILNTE